MNVADYVLHYLEAYVKHIFVLPGGGAMYLNDAFNRSSITPVWMLHEQGAGFAACAYAQMNGLGYRYLQQEKLAPRNQMHRPGLVDIRRSWQHRLPSLEIRHLNHSTEWVASHR